MLTATSERTCCRGSCQGGKGSPGGPTLLRQVPVSEDSLSPSSVSGLHKQPPGLFLSSVGRNPEAVLWLFEQV